MRWNCPHCGTNLAVADEKVGSGWSFSRCYKCAGYGLVRRSDVTLIKVDRAPEGEPVLLPEAHENATAMLSDTATRNLNRIAANAATRSTPAINVTGAAKPVVRTAAARGAPSAPTAKAPRPAASNYGLPKPLPEVPAQTVGQRLTPMAIGIAGLLTIGSGIYLYVQGQALFEKAHTQARESTQPAAPESLSSNETLDEPGPEVILAPSLADNANPDMPVVMDEVHARAMAPARDLPAKAPAHISKRK
jgi:predicted Zn finger-like uncharacterized protein